MRDGSKSNDRRQFYIDVTGIREYFRKNANATGIQRVVVLIIREAILTLGGENVFLFFYDAEKECHLSRSCEKISRRGKLDVNDVNALRSELGLKPLLPMMERSRGVLNRLLLKWEADLSAKAGHESYFLHRNSSIASWKEAKTVLKTHRAAHFSRMARHFPDESIVFLPDFTAASSERFGSLKTHFGSQTKVVSIFYDAIPVLLPKLVNVPSFGIFFDELASSITKFIPISNSASEDLKLMLKEKNITPKIEPVPLARQKILESSGSIAKPRRPIPEAPYILYVGTIENRKNCLALARAWQEISIELPDLPILVFAGRQSSLYPEFADFLGQTNNVMGRVVVFGSPSDSELDHLYQNCLFTAFVSLYEGWGLPIGESIAYGKTGVASSTSSMPEVAEDLMLYADPHDLLSIVDALKRLLTEAGLRESLEAQIATRKLRTWEDVARDMLAVAYGADRPADEQAETRKGAASA